MGADIKALRTRIKSVSSTLHLTKAMGLVASSKVRRATEAMLRGREFVSSLEGIMKMLTACPECAKSPYMQKRGERTRLIVIAGDRGLAGGYNANIFRLVKEFDAEEIIPIGKRACDRFGKEIISSERFYAADAYNMAKAQCEDYLSGKFDRLILISTRFHSMLSQEAFARTLLPLEPSGEGSRASAIFEPDEATILEKAVPEYIAGIIGAYAKESFASEVAARRAAMDSAGKNAGQMIETLQLEYNRARQGAITQEITEIVAGSGN